MFTGIIETLGTVTGLGRLAKSPGTLVLEIDPGRLDRKGLRKGSSVAVNGACLSVVSLKGRRLYFHVIAETQKRTALGRLTAGERVHLERPLAWKGRVDGHFVSGHIDGTARIARIKTHGRERALLVRCPSALSRAIVPKGSVALDGVSLTVGRVSRSAFWVHLIPHTLKHTRFGALRVGARVNLETDLAAKLLLKRRKG